MGPALGIRIELARFRDAGAIADLSRDLIETGLGWSWRADRVLRQLRNRDAVVLKAVDESRDDPVIAGFAIMRFGWDETHLDLLAVQPRYRRRGIGTALLRWLEESALTAGVSIVRLEVRESNGPAIRFYERMGYQSVRLARGYYQGRESAMQMARDLWSELPVGTI
ncbi:MAG: GNAT family N-acetyltransferase [Gammaproteobacteria bacterium]|nr:GNAT family N-acetyltransferase [Gammaproteobacteria bacterium]